MPTTDLTGYTILVTRPEHQAEPLCRLIKNAGGQALRLPVLTIQDSSNTPAVTEKLLHLSDYDLALFISPNAVRYAVDAINKAGGLPSTVQLAAVGHGSARALSKYLDRPAELVPDDQFNSEGLLALEQLQQMGGKRVLIFRGNGGRELIAETLRQRGAQVDYAEVYQRVCPPLLEANDKRLNNADIIVITSTQGLDNLVTMGVALTPAPLFNTPLIVVSENATQQARKLGFINDCLISPKASDETLLNTLVTWAKQHPITKMEAQ